MPRLSSLQFRPAAFAATEWPSPPAPRPLTAPQRRERRRPAALLRLLRAWQERHCQRRELSMMAQRDFGDLAVPPSLVRDEVRRWPWQRPSPQWGAVGAAPAPLFVDPTADRDGR